MVFDDPNELFLSQEAWLWLLKDGQDELKTDDLRSDHVVADLFVTFWLFLAFDRKLDDGAEDKDSVLQGRLSLFRHDKVGRGAVLSAV